ncbi:MAG: aminoglycoside phosphotransferase family protein [Actinomycetota bacterium]
MAKLVDPWWDAHRRHLTSRPSPEGLSALATAVAPTSTVHRVRRLGGGLGSATHAITLHKRNGATFDVVLKRFKADADPRDEWARLRYATRLDVPTPSPVAFDRRGDWFGTPAIVTHRIAGRPTLDPSDIDGWLEQIAMTALTINAASTHRLPAAVRTPVTIRKLPKGLPPSELADRAVAAVQRYSRTALRERHVVSHRDFHPGNLLWSRSKVSGVVDLAYLSLAPEFFDVAYCRIEIAVLHGLRAADRFIAIVEAHLGRRIDHLPIWDVMRGLTALRWSHFWVIAYREQGATWLTESNAHARVRAFLRRALASVDAQAEARAG